MDFNQKVAKFKISQFAIDNDAKFVFTGFTNKDSDKSLARKGHLTFIDGETGNLIIFGG